MIIYAELQFEIETSGPYNYDIIVIITNPCNGNVIELEYTLLHSGEGWELSKRHSDEVISRFNGHDKFNTFIRALKEIKKHIQSL